MRCFGEGIAIYQDYHDREWGRPVFSERSLFEKLALEGFQSGLSWLTILRKRESFRTAFAGFDVDVVAGYGVRDVRRLLADADIVRNRAKIEATITNAQAVLALRQSGTSLCELVWTHRAAAAPAPRRWDQVPSQSAESGALSTELKQRGFRFVGPTTLYALMQSCGLVNDHLATCFARRKVEQLQRDAIAPGS